MGKSDLDLKDLDDILQGNIDNTEDNVDNNNEAGDFEFDESIAEAGKNISANDPLFQKVNSEPPTTDDSEPGTNNKTSPKPIKAADRETANNTESDRNIETLNAIPVDISVILGKTELLVSDLLLMGQGSVIELNKLVGDDLDVFVNGKPIAQGTIVLNNSSFGCKVTRILTPIERLRKLVMEE